MFAAVMSKIESIPHPLPMRHNVEFDVIKNCAHIGNDTSVLYSELHEVETSLHLTNDIYPAYTLFSDAKKTDKAQYSIYTST